MSRKIGPLPKYLGAPLIACFVSESIPRTAGEKRDASLLMSGRIDVG